MMKQPLNVHSTLIEDATTCCTLDYYVGFRMITQRAGESYTNANKDYYNLLFVQAGEIEFSCDDFMKKSFRAGELFFVPPMMNVHSTALTETKILVLTFSNHVESFCDNCTLHHYMLPQEEIQYHFQSLKMTPQVQQFVDLMENYITTGVRCPFLDGLKQKELFAILPYNYKREELSELFYPIIGHNISFKMKIKKIAKEGMMVHEMAERMNMSPRNFSRKFTQEFGEPVRYWLLKQKAKSIRLKLLLPEINLADIIQEYRFTDMSHFTKFCKEYYGCTPAELLKQFR